MTLANKITVLRIIAIPLFVIALIEHYLLTAQIIFVLSIASDALDGTIARIRGERTPLGSFLDPMADKLLLVATYIVFAALHWVPIWVLITILSQGILVIMGWSLVYILTGNSQITPRLMGKATTALQAAVAVARLFNVPEGLYRVTLHLMVAATIVSALDYIWLGNVRLGAIE